MDKLYNYIKKPQKKLISKKHFKKNTKYNKPLEFSFLSEKIYNKILKTDYNYYNYSGIINKIFVDLHIYFPIDNESEYTKYIINNFLLIIHKLVGLSSYSLQKLEITIFLLDNKKQITKNTNIIGVDEVNSGVSIINNFNNKIYIWRKEEVFKVLIHELIHSLDFDPITNSKYEILLNKFSYCSKEINLFEAYVEFWATLLNILFTMSKDNIEFNHFNLFIKAEILHGYRQVSKILQFYNIINFEEFFNIDGKIKKKCLFKEESNVFMYYLGKLLLLINYNNILELCLEYSNKYIINIKKSIEFTENLVNLMVDSLNRNSTILNFEHFLELEYDNSLKMSYYG